MSSSPQSPALAGQLGPARPGGARVQRVVRLVAYELLSGLSWLPMVVVASVLVVVLPAVAAWLADVERARVQRLGGLPSGPTRRLSEGTRAWLTRRRVSGQLFRQDVALFAVLTLMGLPSMVLTAVFVVAAVLIPLQVLTDPSKIRIGISGDPMTPWQALLVAMVCAAAACLGLLALATVRVRVVRALSHSPEHALEARVDALERGRSTLVTVFEAERRRIERDLHDGAQQELVALNLELGRAELAATSLPTDLAEPIRTALGRAHDRADAALSRLRESVRRIHPTVLDDLGLFAGMEDMVAHAGFPVSLVCSGDDSRVTAPSSAAAYFAVAEALTNTVKHAGAVPARVTVNVCDRVQVEVADTGPGGADPSQGSGLAGLAERIETLGGTFTVDSPHGCGTRLRAEVPLAPGRVTGRPE